MNTLSFSMAFLMGLTGSLHCAGMCGPIILILPFQLLSGFRKILALGLYHFGRVSVYAFMAWVLFSFRSMFNPQLQQYVSVTLGISLLLVGILSFIPSQKLQLKLPWANFVKGKFAHFISNPQIGTLFFAGILNGLLPCGLVYMALSVTVASSNALQAATLMYAFGLGTMPILISITLLKKKAAFLKLSHIRKLVPLMLFAFGTLFILRGMNLGIPYLSPKLEVTDITLKASCCHRH